MRISDRSRTDFDRAKIKLTSGILSLVTGPPRPFGGPWAKFSFGTPLATKTVKQAWGPGQIAPPPPPSGRPCLCMATVHCKRYPPFFSFIARGWHDNVKTTRTTASTALQRQSRKQRDIE